MMHLPFAPSTQTLDTLIKLASVSRLHPIVVGGCSSTELFLALQRHGFTRVALVSSYRSPRAEFLAGMVAEESSYRALELSVIQVSRSLTTNATIAISLKSVERGLSLRMASKLEQLGFRVEAGTQSPQGFILSARRGDFA